MKGDAKAVGNSAHRLRGPVYALVAVLVLSSAHPRPRAEPETPKLVVVIYPGESDGAPGIVLINQALRSTFASQSPGHIEVRNEYVDTTRLRDAEFMRAQVSLLQRKYAGRKVDLVIAGLSSGLDFALQYRDEVFPGVPVVFVAVDQREVKARRLPPDVIGVPIRMDLAGTLDLALRLHPDTRRVFVVAGSSPFDTEWEAEARRTFRPYEDRLEFVYLTGLPMDELLGRVADLPEQSIVYYLHIHRDGTGKPFVSAEALERLAARANAPIYGHVDTYVGRGIVGGHVFTFRDGGEERGPPRPADPGRREARDDPGPGGEREHRHVRLAATPALGDQRAEPAARQRRPLQGADLLGRSTGGTSSGSSPSASSRRC